MERHSVDTDGGGMKPYAWLATAREHHRDLGVAACAGWRPATWDGHTYTEDLNAPQPKRACRVHGRRDRCHWKARRHAA